MTRRRSAILAIALSLGLVLGACGDDATPDAADDDSGQSSEDGGGGAFTVTVTADSIEAPEEVAGGVVEVTLETDAPEGESELNFTKVAAGTSEADFRTAIASATSGGPIPPVIEATGGILNGTQSLELPEGSYFIWADKIEPEGEGGPEGEGEGAEGEGEGGEEGGPPTPNPDAFLVHALTVTAGEGELPDTGSTVVARDYTFDIDVNAGDEQFTFRNEGPDQLHHVVFMNFGDVPADDVEEHLPAFLESEGEGEQPEPFTDLNMEEVFAAGGSAVFTPGLGGTNQANFESGNTYAAVCFIGDRAGGPPHAIAHGMRVVFEVE